jgi:hypothetical protein
VLELLPYLLFCCLLLLLLMLLLLLLQLLCLIIPGHAEYLTVGSREIALAALKLVALSSLA